MLGDDELRVEFPHADSGYARKFGDAARRLCDRYNAARERINPSVPTTIARARKIKAQLVETCDDRA